MGLVERTIFGRPALSGSLWPDFSVHNTDHGSSTLRTLDYVDTWVDGNSAQVSHLPYGVRTHHSLSYGHRDILLYQVI